MTITITEQQMYIGIIILLLLLQIYQQVQIKKLEKECSNLWEQLGVLVASLTSQIIQLQRDINSKQDKNTGSEANRDTK